MLAVHATHKANNSKMVEECIEVSPYEYFSLPVNNLLLIIMYIFQFKYCNRLYAFTLGVVDNVVNVYNSYRTAVVFLCAYIVFMRN